MGSGTTFERRLRRPALFHGITGVFRFRVAVVLAAFVLVVPGEW